MLTVTFIQVSAEAGDKKEIDNRNNRAIINSKKPSLFFMLLSSLSINL
jgi:hypothetical protein